MTGAGWRALFLACVCFLAACSTAQPASFASATSDVDPDGGSLVADDAVSADAAVLSSRLGASVVWTGEEMIVSGGFAASPSDEFSDTEVLFDGAAFDPGSDSWRPIADRPGGVMSWTSSFWTGQHVLVVGAGGVFAYDPALDEWTILPDPPFPLPDLVRDNEFFEAAWSGQHLYVWRPSTDEMAAWSPDTDAWRVMPAPHFDAYPTKLLADGQRLVALGTGWPSSGVPVSPAVEAAEWVDNEWRSYSPASFITESDTQNTADVDAAVLINGVVVVWGDDSNDPSPTYLLDAEGNWSEASPFPINAGNGHPGSIVTDGRVVGLTESSEAAIFDPAADSWTIADYPAANGPQAGWPGSAANQMIWTGSEILSWTGSTVASWTP